MVKVLPTVVTNSTVDHEQHQLYVDMLLQSHLSMMLHKSAGIHPGNMTVIPGRWKEVVMKEQLCVH